MTSARAIWTGNYDKNRLMILYYHGAAIFSASCLNCLKKRAVASILLFLASSAASCIN